MRTIGKADEMFYKLGYRKTFEKNGRVQYTKGEYQSLTRISIYRNGDCLSETETISDKFRSCFTKPEIFACAQKLKEMEG